MRRYNDSLLHSASDLNAFLGCAHAAALNLRAIDDPALRAGRAVDDASAALVQDAEHAHEAGYLAAPPEVAEISKGGSLESAAAASTHN